MKPFPPLTKVFALVIHEERQQNINYGSSSFGDLPILGDYNSASANAHTSSVPSKGKRERPQCVHYGLQGHIMCRTSGATNSPKSNCCCIHLSTHGKHNES
ncbi:hypothetical protein PVL29_018999 [Vitis rotundifolia]|uniref:Uncharacterized protein n=1 Tax=Vitis rotundifolia TaxID=103349 RepID=A0AA38Z6N2_VITRO|nr:hypothetical protein PVL29_018999 [Vitis rotundifolia]